MGVSTDGSVAPIIVKKKKVAKQDGHHGGAWKVAYADFVTAMMAFFLLMWLLNATTEEQRKGISDYFNPTIPISRISGGGSDGLNGSSIFTEDTLAKMGTGASRQNNESAPKPSDIRDEDKLDEATSIAQNFESLKDAMAREGVAMSQHLLVKITPEGLVLEIMDSETDPLFAIGESRPSELLPEILSMLAEKFSTFTNDIKIVGHTDARGFRSGADYDNWDLSFDRANVARRLLLGGGVNETRVLEVSGKADTDPLIEDDPLAPQNRRISITILVN